MRLLVSRVPRVLDLAAMYEQSALTRFVAALGRLVSLPETQIRKRFESMGDGELDAYQTALDEAIGTADQFVGVNEEESPPPTT